MKRTKQRFQSCKRKNKFKLRKLKGVFDIKISNLISFTSIKCEEDLIKILKEEIKKELDANNK